MKVGIAIWDDQVSPLLDAATQLLIAEIAECAVKSKEIVRLPLLIPAHRVSFIQETSIEVLICGALSRHYESMLGLCNIKVVPWIRGSVDDVTAAYMRGELDRVDYCLPGRMRGRRQCRNGGGRRRAWISRREFHSEEE